MKLMRDPRRQVNAVARMECRFVIVGLSSNSGGETFTFEHCSTRGSEVVVTVALVAPSSGGDYDLDSTVITAQLPLSIIRLRGLLEAIETWLATDVSNAGLLDGKHSLAAPDYGVFDMSFGKRNDLVSAAEKPTVTLHYKFGRLNGEFAFVTDQSCLRDFSNDLQQLTSEIAG